jgi:hypothetical protein
LILTFLDILETTKLSDNKFKVIQSTCFKKGNTTTPSFGNVHLWVNLLTPAGDATNIDNLQSSTFVGLDSEAWNLAVQAQSYDAHAEYG